MSRCYIIWFLEEATEHYNGFKIHFDVWEMQSPSRQAFREEETAGRKNSFDFFQNYFFSYVEE